MMVRRMESILRREMPEVIPEDRCRRRTVSGCKILGLQERRYWRHLGMSSPRDSFDRRYSSCTGVHSDIREQVIIPRLEYSAFLRVEECMDLRAPFEIARSRKFRSDSRREPSNLPR